MAFSTGARTHLHLNIGVFRRMQTLPLAWSESRGKQRKQVDIQVEDFVLTTLTISEYKYTHIRSDGDCCVRDCDCVCGSGWFNPLKDERNENNSSPSEIQLKHISCNEIVVATRKRCVWREKHATVGPLSHRVFKRQRWSATRAGRWPQMSAKSVPRRTQIWNEMQWTVKGMW